MSAIILPAICDRAAARTIHPDLRDAIGPQKLAINASGVERIGQAMLQLLISAANSESGIVLISPSDAFLKAISLAGLETVLGGDIERPEAA